MIEVFVKLTVRKASVTEAGKRLHMILVAVFDV